MRRRFRFSEGEKVWSFFVEFLLLPGVFCTAGYSARSCTFRPCQRALPGPRRSRALQDATGWVGSGQVKGAGLCPGFANLDSNDF